MCPHPPAKRNTLKCNGNKTGEGGGGRPAQFLLPLNSPPPPKKNQQLRRGVWGRDIKRDPPSPNGAPCAAILEGGELRGGPLPKKWGCGGSKIGRNGPKKRRIGPKMGIFKRRGGRGCDPPPPNTLSHRGNMGGGGGEEGLTPPHTHCAFGEERGPKMGGGQP